MLWLDLFLFHCSFTMPCSWSFLELAHQAASIVRLMSQRSLCFHARKKKVLKKSSTLGYLGIRNGRITFGKYGVKEIFVRNTAGVGRMVVSWLSFVLTA